MTTLTGKEIFPAGVFWFALDKSAIPCYSLQEIV